MVQEWRRGDYSISTERALLDLNLIHDYLSNKSYWATGRARETIVRSIENSLSFGLYSGAEHEQEQERRQVGFARVITDYATFAWVADVFILEEARGQGLGKWMMKVILAHPELQGFRRWILATKDAHELYRKFGFAELKRPERWMERHDPKTEERPDYWANTS